MRFFIDSFLKFFKLVFFVLTMTFIGVCGSAVLASDLEEKPVILYEEPSLSFAAVRDYQSYRPTFSEVVMTMIFAPNSGHYLNDFISQTLLKAIESGENHQLAIAGAFISILRNEDIEPSMNFLEKQKDSQPEQLLVLMGLALGYLRLKDTATFDVLRDRMLQLFPDQKHELYMFFGLSLLLTDFESMALPYFATLVELGENHVEVWRAFGWSLYFDGRTKEWLNDYSERASVFHDAGIARITHLSLRAEGLPCQAAS